MTKERELANISEQNKYLDQLRLANQMVEKYLATHSPYDKADLFRIAMNSFKTPEEMLATGLRRRVISGI